MSSGFPTPTWIHRSLARRFDRMLLVLLAAVALGLVALHHAPALRELEYRVLDLGFRARRAWFPSVAPEIVLVGVDEGSEQAFPEPFSLWHRHFAEVFTGLAQGGVRGVGVDFAFPSCSQDALVAGGDAELVGGILRLRSRAPLVLGLTVDSAFQTRQVFPPFLAAAGLDGFGMVLAPADADGRLRRFLLRAGPGGTEVPTLTGVLARRLAITPRDGLVDYSYGAPFRYIPFHQVAAWQRSQDLPALKSAFDARVVLVGSVLPREDRHPMAINLAAWEMDFGEAPGLIYHAQVLRCLLGKGLIQELPTGWVWVMSLTMTVGFWLVGRKAILGMLTLAFAWVLLAAAFLFALGSSWFLPPLAPAGAGFLALAARTGWGAILQTRERRALQEAFSGHVSPGLLREILAGRRVPVCLLFSDIRGFTTLSESMPPEEVITLLNRYFTRMTEVVHARGGTLDKFMGDGLMAFFGAPEPLADASLAAFEAAQDMLQALAVLNLEFTAEGRPALAIGIGLHFGEVAVGYVGSPSRHQYTAIGDAVNLASRVEGLTKEAGFPVLCTSAVAECLGTKVRLAPLGEHSVRGRGPVVVFGWRPEIAECQGGST